MAQEIQILHWCDWCMTEGGDKVAALSFPVATREGEVQDVDLCDDHGKALDGFYDLAAAAHASVASSRPPGRPRGASSTAPKTLACPACPTMFATRAGVTSHVEDVHGFRILQWEGWNGVKENGVPVVLWCETCGSGFSHTSAWGHHRKNTGHEEFGTKRPPKSVYPESVLSLASSLSS